MGNVSLSFSGQVFEPLPCGALFWPAQSMLIVADLHLEKGSHFARRGWLLPPYDSLETLRRLSDALARTGARRIVALGDSFHDAGGPRRMQPAARDMLARLLTTADWLWVTGNHDGDSGVVLGGSACVEAEIGGIVLRHEAQPGWCGPEISGHYHPKVSLPLRTGRRVSRKCLALTPTRMLLPAYGAFAGGLSVDDPAVTFALGCRPDAVVTLANGLVRLSATQRELAA